jgi:putative NADPH-quinone reductase
MQVLVVAAHPCPESFNHAVLERACRGLRSGGHSVDVIDLYRLHEQGFDPVMHETEWTGYIAVAPPPADSAAVAPLDPLLATHVDLVNNAEAIVFVYPTWWSSVPAILKGWLERVLRPGVAFTIDPRGRAQPALRGVRRLVGISTYGSSRWYVRLVNDNGRRLVSRTMRVCTGGRARTSWLGLYSIDTSDAARREVFLDRVEQRMATLGGNAP